jgi:hypothetical protein
LAWLQPNISTPVVQSWLQHFEASWGEVLPPHLLQHVAAAIAAAEGASAPQEHPSSSSAMQMQQAYKLLPYEHSLQSASTAAASSSNHSSSSNNSAGCIGAEVCSNVVHAAGSVLGLDAMDHPGICRRILLSPGLERTPLLLPSSATAALWLDGLIAISTALGCGFSASALVHSSWCEGSEGQPCAVCAELLSPLAWPTVGLLALQLQQAVAAAVGTIQDPAWSSGISDGGGSGSGGSSGGSGGRSGSRGGGGSSNGSSGGGSSGNSSGGSSASRGSVAHAAGTALLLPVASGLKLYMDVTGSLLQVSLSRAVHRASPGQLLQRQLQPVSLAIQLLEAAIRCRSQLEQLLAQHGVSHSRWDGSTVGFKLGALMPAAVCMCNVGLSVVGDSTSSDIATTPSHVVTGVQQVLQAVMSLCLTAVSTAQGEGGDVPMLALLTECVNLQQTILQHSTAAAAAAAALGLSATAATSLSATVAAGWYTVGRCLLQLSEQLKLCASQPDTYKLSGWVLTSAQVYDCSRSAVCQRGVSHGLAEVVTALSVLVDAVAEFQQQHLTSPAAGGSSGAGLWLALYRDRLVKAKVCLEEDVCKSLAILRDPEVLATLLDPPPAHQQQRRQKHRRHQQQHSRSSSGRLLHSRHSKPCIMSAVGSNSLVKTCVQPCPTATSATTQAAGMRRV